MVDDQDKLTNLIDLFDTTSDLAALTHAIEILRSSLRSFEVSDRSFDMANTKKLADALKSHYDYTGNVTLLDESICLYRSALSNTHPDHPTYTDLASDLSLALYCSFYEKRGGVASILESVHLSRISVAASNAQNPHLSKYYSNLACTIFAKYLAESEAADIEEAISVAREAVKVVRLGDVELSRALNCLGCMLGAHFQVTGDIQEEEEAIGVLREALQLRPPGYPTRLKTLNNLAGALSLMYRHTGRKELLVESNLLFKEAIGLTPERHPARVGLMANLANALIFEFHTTQNIELLEDAARYFRESIRLRTPSNPMRPISVNGLAGCLQLQFAHFGDEEALFESTRLLRELLEQQRGNASQGVRDLDNTKHRLGESLMSQYGLTGNVELLAEAIELLRASLQSSKHGANDIEHAEYLCSLGRALLAYSENSKDFDILTEAIASLREGLQMTQPESLDRPNLLNALGRALQNAFGLTKNLSFLGEAIRSHHTALQTYSPGDPRSYETHHLTARALLRDSPSYSWNEAMTHLSSAEQDSNVSARHRFKTTTDTVFFIESSLVRDREDCTDHFSRALEIYAAAINLLPRASVLGLDVRSRLRELLKAGQLCRLASARAILLGQDKLAIELLEEGLAVFWTSNLRMRATALDILVPSERNELIGLFLKLEVSAHPKETSTNHENLEALIAERRALSLRAEELIDEIRLRPGFDRFLRIPSFPNLSRAAARGIVVMLIASDVGYFAHCVTKPDQDPITIPLDSLSPGSLKDMTLNLTKSGMRDRGAVSTDLSASDESDLDRLGLRLTRSDVDTSALRMLEQIWTAVVKPTFNALGLQKSEGCFRPRVYWCSAGEFTSLPLHAAGIYTGLERECTMDYAVSSYTPSLSALIKSQESFEPIPRTDLKALLIAEPLAPNLPPLHNVQEEIKCVSTLLSKSCAVLNDIGTTPDEESILKDLPMVHVLHLARHGQQRDDPLDSCFILKNGSLSISTLMKIDLPSAVFAFLSACETAKGDARQPDQAVHLAASMLFCGFRSVIATMWSMNDADGPEVARHVYETLLAKESIGIDDVAYALDRAVQALRLMGVAPARWATFIHMGA